LFRHSGFVITSSFVIRHSSFFKKCQPRDDTRLNISSLAATSERAELLPAMPWVQSIPFLAHLKRRDRDRLARYNIVVAILLAGWFPSILMLVVSYTILTKTLETKILHDRQTFVQLIAHLVGDDLSHTGSVIEYYQTQPDVAKILSGPAASNGAQQWLAQTFYSHPRIDGMFITGVEGNLIASLPAISPEETQNFSAALWREGAMGSPDV